MNLGVLLLVVAGTLRGGETRSVPLELARGEAIRVEVMQDGVDVVVTLDGPGGHVEVDSPNGTQGVEPLLFIARAPGAHTLTVRPLSPSAPEGRYTLRVVYRRPATAADRRAVELLELHARAWGLRDEQRQLEALPLADRAVALARPGSLELAQMLTLRGYLLDELARYAPGARDLARALAIRERRLGPDDNATLVSRADLGWLLAAEGRFAEAERGFRSVLAARERLALPTANTLAALGDLHRRRGDLPAAEDFLRRALAAQRDEGQRDGDRYALGHVLVRQGGARLDEGEALCAGAASALASRPSFQGLTAWSARLCVAEARLARGDLAAAAPEVDAVLARREAVRGREHPQVAEALVVRARVESLRGDRGAARASLERARAIREAIWPADHPAVVEVRRLLSALT